MQPPPACLRLRAAAAASPRPIPARAASPRPVTAQPSNRRRVSGGAQRAPCGREAPPTRGSDPPPPEALSGLRKPWDAAARTRPETQGPASGYRGTYPDGSAPQRAGGCSSRTPATPPPPPHAASARLSQIARRRRRVPATNPRESCVPAPSHRSGAASAGSAPNHRPSNRRRVSGGAQRAPCGREAPPTRGSDPPPPEALSGLRKPWDAAARTRPETQGPASGYRGTYPDGSAPQRAGGCSSRTAGDSLPLQTYACIPRLAPPRPVHRLSG
ncbi:PREDICTED: formin-like protein 5-like [Lipotes vexillifer]|uniref:Formin-like protein 5-like n=1 Tax=Lipotes vexillifer TaxID=118797 RepID=A0A340WY40_LIPVE|nr:PREDICTED: formin-like protein 5-like [Lipotes vexillifer]